MTPLLAHHVRADRTFERIYKRHVGDVYRYTLAVLRNPADAEDVTQTTFLNAYRAFERGERPRHPQNWLIAIAHNVCRQRFRQSARRPEEVEFDDRVGEIVPEDDDQRWSAEDIQRALGHLAFNQRAALVMRELEGRSYPEIAEILGISVSAVETLIFRARRALREQLEGSLTCGEAERAISRQLDGRLARAERGALRAHLRECAECARFARSQRAQRTAIKSLALIPVPSSLTGLFGGGAAGGGVAIKAAAVVAAGTVAVGAGYEGAQRAELFVPGSGEPIAATELTSAPPAVAAADPRVLPARPLADEASAARHVAAARGKSVARRGKPAAKAKPTTPVARGNPYGSAPPPHAVARGHERAGSTRPHVQPPRRAAARAPKAPPRIGRATPVAPPRPKPARPPKPPTARAPERGGGKKDALQPAAPLPEAAAEITRTVTQVFQGAGV